MYEIGRLEQKIYLIGERISRVSVFGSMLVECMILVDELHVTSYKPSYRKFCLPICRTLFLEALDLIKKFLTLNAIKIIGQFEGASRAHHS